MELKELKDMIEPVENWEYEFSGTREVGKSYMQNLLNNKDKVINDLLKRISDLEFEIERLNNNWNKLEEWLNIQQNISSPEQILNNIFNKLQELKGNTNEKDK